MVSNGANVTDSLNQLRVFKLTVIKLILNEISFIKLICIINFSRSRSYSYSLQFYHMIFLYHNFENNLNM